MAVAGKVAITLSTENGGAWSADVTYDRLVAVKHNNNLYISRKTVANVEPPNDEFWFLALEGFGGEDVESILQAIENIINGTTQVGNAKSLDGHGVEYFAPLEARTPKLVAQLPSTTTESEVNNTLDDLSASYPNETLYEVQVNWAISHSKFGGGKFVIRGWKYTDIYETQTISNDAWDYSYMRKKNRNGWQQWVKSATDADLAKYLPLDGGGTVRRAYMSPIVLKNTTGSACFTGYYGVNGELGYLGFDGVEKPTFQQKDGTKRELLHTGNKPTGSYTGNGDATKRTINTGGVGNVAMIYRSGEMYIVTASGVLKVNSSGISFGTTASFVGGTLKISSASEMNVSGVTYTYQVL